MKQYLFSYRNKPIVVTASTILEAKAMISNRYKGAVFVNIIKVLP